MHFHPGGVDVLVRNFLLRAQVFSQKTVIAGPFLFRVALCSPQPLIALDAFDAEDGRIEAGYWELSAAQVSNILDPIERIIRPICDHVHQMFGNARSPYFDDQGRWRGP